MNAVMKLPDLATRINAEHAAAEASARTAVEHAIECGRLLAEAKAALEHGQWLPWLAENITFTERTAQRWMQLAEKSDTVSHLPTVREALAHLAEPKEPSLREQILPYVRPDDVRAVEFSPGEWWCPEHPDTLYATSHEKPGSPGFHVYEAHNLDDPMYRECTRGVRGEVLDLFIAWSWRLS